MAKTKKSKSGRKLTDAQREYYLENMCDAMIDDGEEDSDLAMEIAKDSLDEILNDSDSSAYDELINECIENDIK